MKRLYTIFALAAALMLAGGCKQAAEPYPMFWTWLEDIPSIDMESAFTHMEEAGLDAVMLHAASVEDYIKDVEIARRHGIRVWAWVWTLNPPRQERPQMLEEHPDWFSVNRNGESVNTFKAYVNSYKFLCPALPEVRDYLKEKVKTICEIDGVEGICLDYCRLIDCVLPISLAYNYNLRQDTEVWSEYDFGYHPAMIEKFVAQYGYDPRTLEDPSRDERWCQFRCDQVTEVANMMAEVAHSYGKTVSASPFSAAGVAKFMVFQEWGKWDLDMVFPMNYTDFYTMDKSFAYDATVENNKAKGPNTTLFCGIDTELGGDPATTLAKMDEAFRAGALGISLYTIEGLDTPELRAGFKAYADSLRALRKANGGVVPFTPAEAANMDPFANEGLMAVVRRNIQRVAAGEAIHEKSVNGMVKDDPAKVYPDLELGDFELVRQTDRLLEYKVTDAESGQSFKVLFITYGNVISGWDVRPLAETEPLPIKR